MSASLVGTAAAAAEGPAATVVAHEPVVHHGVATAARPGSGARSPAALAHSPGPVGKD